MLDGFDVLVMSFFLGLIQRTHSLSTGHLLSAGLFGMAIGSISLGALADRLEEKISQYLSCLVTLVCLHRPIQNQEQLFAFRFVTGLELEDKRTTLVQNAQTISRGFVSDFFSQAIRWGPFRGIVSVYLIDSFGWRSLFIFGGHYR